MSQEPPKQPEQEPHPRKPGPHEKLHSLFPLTFEQAIDRAMKFKPIKPTKPKKRKRKPPKEPTR